MQEMLEMQEMLDGEGWFSAAGGGFRAAHFANRGGWVEAERPDPIGVPNGTCIDPSILFAPWV